MRHKKPPLIMNIDRHKQVRNAEVKIAQKRA